MLHIIIICLLQERILCWHNKHSLQNTCLYHYQVTGHLKYLHKQQCIICVDTKKVYAIKYYNRRRKCWYNYTDILGFLSWFLFTTRFEVCIIYRVNSVNGVFLSYIFNASDYLRLSNEVSQNVYMKKSFSENDNY